MAVRSRWTASCLLALVATARGAFAPAPAVRHVAMPRVSQAIVAAVSDEAQSTVRDALMHRAVELQVNAFAIVADVASKQYLSSVWASFIERQVSMGCARPSPAFVSPPPPASMSGVRPPPSWGSDPSPETPFWPISTTDGGSATAGGREGILVRDFMRLKKSKSLFFYLLIFVHISYT